MRITMRMSRLFSQTLRETPAEAEIPSHQLLLRAGFIRQLAAGVFSYLPLARRSLSKIENIIREEMNAIGGQELTMPVIHPADIWKETRRWFEIDAEMGRFVDRGGRDMVLAMTHEEVVADLVRKEIRSYRQLPQLIYHIQTKWRDDPRPRAGLIRVREFTMKDSYSLDADWEGLDLQYKAHYQAYFNIFRRCGLPVIAVKSDVGMMGGKLAHEFMYLTPIGEDSLLICNHCGFSANRQIAGFRKIISLKEIILPLEKVSTPDCKTIEQLAIFLGIPKSRTAKAVFLVAEIPNGDRIQEKFIFVVIRGDMEVNETKLSNVLKSHTLRPASEAEICAVGAAPGYASPVGLKGIMVVVDDAIPESPNLVAGANEDGFHLRNVNFGRDIQADIVTDIAAASEGDACANCGGTLTIKRGVEVGNIFKLGTRYSEALGCFFQDAEGNNRPVIMGSYGIGSGRLLACVAEQYHDENGLIWPVSVAPFHVHLISLVGKDLGKTQRTADRLYSEMIQAQIEVLYDDRTESPGVKFKDADLIGLPIRLTISEKALSSGGCEIKLRNQQTRELIPIDQVIERICVETGKLQASLETALKTEVLETSE